MSLQLHPEEALELLSTPEGRQRVLAEALSRASVAGATRNEVDAAKEMRQCALAAAALLEREELEALAARMEDVRALFGKRIEITSGYRDPQVNAAVGGVKKSAHALGHAADFHVADMHDLAAAKRIRDSKLKFDQLIYEKNRCVHISFDPQMRRQVMRQPGGPGSKCFPGLEP